MALMIPIKVVPRSRQKRWKYSTQQQLTCYITAAPEKGKANQEIINFIAATLKIPKKAVSIVKGHAVRTKLIAIDQDISYEECIQRLGLGCQKKLF